MTSILKVDTIQDQAGNNIINESSDTITIGASGDTITIPSGATLSPTDPLVFPAGTVSLPSITTTGDTNTGIFFPAADTIAFTEGGTEAMRITSDGNVGVGQDTPSTKFEIKTLQTSDNGLTITADGTSYGYSPNIFFRTKLTSGGVIGVSGRIQALLTENGGGALVFYTVNSSTNAERMRIDTTGRFVDWEKLINNG
jgi:hypothetical protein